MIEYDRVSPEGVLVFKLTFPFIKINNLDDGHTLVSNKLDAYRCASIVMNILKQEFSNQNIKVPEYYNTAHQIITETILDEESKSSISQ